jgi:hypothetical protein
MEQGDVINIKYPVLFSVKLMHHYFLDAKTQTFDEMTDDAKLKMLAGYDIRTIFSIRPTAETIKTMNGNGLLMREHGLGFTVICKQLPASGGGFEAPARLPEGTKLRFTVKVNDPLFYNYSSPFMKKETARIEKAIVLGEQDRVFFKTYLLSNEVGNLAGAMSPNLSKPPIAAESLAAPYPVESLLTVGGVLKQAKVRAPNLNAANWQTVFNGHFVSDADIEEVEAGPEFQPGIFAIIEISASSAISNAAYRLYEPDNSLASPNFEIRIKNRSTWWRYHGMVVPSTEYLPLTAKTVVKLGGKDVPNPSGRTPVGKQLEPDNLNINRLFSEIYL